MYKSEKFSSDNRGLCDWINEAPASWLHHFKGFLLPRNLVTLTTSSLSDQLVQLKQKCRVSKKKKKKNPETDL